MGCSDNWARDLTDQEELRERREKARKSLSYSGDAQDTVSPTTLRESRYFNQFVKVVELLTEDQLKKQILDDKEFRSLFMELQNSKRLAGLDWIECKFNQVILLTPWLQVELIYHKLSK